VSDTELAQLFAIAADQIESWGAADADAETNAPPRLLWLHARGYHGAWDAPTEMRQSLLDEEDPPALEFVAPPTRLETHDHDELLLHRSAYAAQTMVLDQCIGMLQETLDAAGLTDSTLVALVGCRGFALGEHGAVGSDVRDLYSELTHIPLIVRRPGGDSVPPPRCSELVQPLDLLPSLLSWFEAAAEPAAGRNLLATDGASIQPVREVAYASGAVGEIALRTHSWWMRQSGSRGKDGDAAGSVELFSKPDDRWEANEIADRCPNEAANLLALAEEFRRCEPG
jgi:arylsulfatase A-like enzyme